MDHSTGLHVLPYKIRKNVTDLFLFSRVAFNSKEYEDIRKEQVSFIQADGWTALCRYCFDSPHNFMLIDTESGQVYKNLNRLQLR
jgi:hypothetical protein